MKATPGTSNVEVRPVVYDYKSPSLFFRDMMDYQKSTRPYFSVRASTKRIKGCSPSLITQVLNGKRRLTRNQLPVFAKIFHLNNLEEDFLDKQLRADFLTLEPVSLTKTDDTKIPKNHILKDWINVYVKDSCHLRGFKPDPKTVYRLLGGLSNPDRIARSIKYLFEEGFWRTTVDKNVVLDEVALTTTNNIPDKKIRQFHRWALQVVREGIEKYPPNRRFSSTVLVTVDRTSLDKLKTMVNKFQNELLQFIEENPDGDEQLYQVNINLTPVGGKSESQ